LAAQGVTGQVNDGGGAHARDDRCAVGTSGHAALMQAAIDGLAN
jgi:hypothetical protein